MTVRVALADDQALVRAGLRALLKAQQVEVVFEANDGADLLEKLETQPVDVVLSDIRMPGVDGIDALIRLRERGDRTPVLLLTTFDDSDLLLRATEAGYEVGTRTAVDVLDARRQVIANQTSYSQSRYTYLNNLIQLRLASGDLDRGTIEEINKWLVVPSQAPAPNPTPAAP